MRTTKLLSLIVGLSLFGSCSNQKGRTGENQTAGNNPDTKLTAQTSSSQYRICMDIAHDQIFWNDPANMEEQDLSLVERVNYMTGELGKNAASLNAGLDYLTTEIQPDHLVDCDVLFIHTPSARYSPVEIDAITQYLRDGGALFLVMDVDYWSTLEQANVNDILRPFDIQFAGSSPDTVSGGYTKADLITKDALKIPYHGARIVEGGTPFCFSRQSEDHPFGTFTTLENGGKIVAMGEGMVSLYMTSWQGVHDYQCGEFMQDVFQWLLE